MKKTNQGGFRAALPNLVTRQLKKLANFESSVIAKIKDRPWGIVDPR